MLYYNKEYENIKIMKKWNKNEYIFIKHLAASSYVPPFNCYQAIRKSVWVSVTISWLGLLYTLKKYFSFQILLKSTMDKYYYSAKSAIKAYEYIQLAEQ